MEPALKAPKKSAGGPRRRSPVSRPPLQPAPLILMNNLPYMGELTFGDGRPRRGRKPKKADICHLISKNYGITFPSAYVNEPNSGPPRPRRRPSPPPLNLLMDSVSRLSGPPPPDQPLNLCLRDRGPQALSLVRPGRKGPPAPAWAPRPKKKARDGFSSPSSAAAAAAAVAASNSAQVSICKFKFTGGERPCLQEKKMLSVDSGGNFRFYSDKPCSSRAGEGGSPGREETHFQPAASPLGLPKSAKSMSMCMMPGPSGTSPAAALCPPPARDPGSSSSDESAKEAPARKRRTRKSLMRERLEKRFSEKGFLIQTEQLESAEGATYCKFRQLRKFTRYLFRSWKDYLPQNMGDMTEGRELDLSVTPAPRPADSEDDS